MTQRKLKIRRKRTEIDGQVTATYVQRAIQEQLEALGLSEFLQWRSRVEDNLHLMRVILSDVRDAARLVESSAGSVRSQMNELLHLLEASFKNLEEFLEPRDREVNEEVWRVVQEQRRQEQHVLSFVDDLGRQLLIRDLLAGR